MPTASAIQDQTTEKILRTILVNGSLGIVPSGFLGAWPIYMANEPDTPDNCVTIFETSGITQGRLMPNGAYVYRPGYQIRVRSNNYETGRQRGKDIAIYLSETLASNSTLVVGSNTYTIHNVSISSGPIPIGKDVETSKRYLFTINGTMKVSQEP